MTDLNQLYLKYSEKPSNDTQFWPAVMEYIAQLTTDEDLQQITVMRVYEAISDYRHENHIERWIARVQRNAKTDDLRKHKDDALDEATLECISNAIPAPRAFSLDLSVIVDPLDMTIVESVLEGYLLKEAADRCCVSVATVKRRLKRLGEKLGHPCALSSR